MWREPVFDESQWHCVRTECSIGTRGIVSRDNVTNPQGGSIAITAQNLDLENSSPRIRAGVARGTSILPSGNIYIDVVDRLIISTGGFINRVDSSTSEKSGVSGDINITDGSIILRNENVVSPNVFAACQCLKCTSG